VEFALKILPSTSPIRRCAIGCAALFLLGACGGESESESAPESALSPGASDSGGRAVVVGRRGSSQAEGVSCADGVAIVTRVAPTVWLVVDGSSSMQSEFAASESRWDALRSTLMDRTGVVASLQNIVRFGLVIYSGGETASQCPTLLTVDPALNNFAAIDAMYPMETDHEGTPTDRALDYVFTNFAMLDRPLADTLANPVYVILATDGAPNDPCGTADDGPVRQRVVDLTADASRAGANVYVISLAGDDTSLASHLDEVAGVTTSKHRPFVPAKKQQLIEALSGVVTDGTCQVILNGTVRAGEECKGEVSLEGESLACDRDDGWRLTSPNTLQLTGTACSTFLSKPSSRVEATFPCEIFVPD
jgi:hypothetical protein